MFAILSAVFRSVFIECLVWGRLVTTECAGMRMTRSVFTPCRAPVCDVNVIEARETYSRSISSRKEWASEMD